MLSDIEFNFSILEYKVFGDTLLSFKYSLSMYYKNNDIKGSHVKTDNYILNLQIHENLNDINSIIKYLLEKEDASSIEETSIFKSCFDELKTEVFNCFGSKWSLTNIQKFN